MTCCATEAVRRHPNRLALQVADLIEKITEVAMASAQRQAQLLVEVAIKKLPLPVHTDQTAAHHRLKVLSPMSLLELL